MTPIQEVFLETEWDDASAARQARDQRVAELSAQGFECTCETLYTILDGKRVFLLEATETKNHDVPRGRGSVERRDLENRRPKPVNHHLPQYEKR